MLLCQVRTSPAEALAAAHAMRSDVRRLTTSAQLQRPSKADWAKDWRPLPLGLDWAPLLAVLGGEQVHPGTREQRDFS